MKQLNKKLEKVIPGYTCSRFDYINCMTCKHRIRTVNPGVMMAWYDDLDCELIKNAGLSDRIELNCICKNYSEFDYNNSEWNK